MSAPLDIATSLVTSGAAGAAAITLFEAVRSWYKRRTKPKEKDKTDVRVIIRRGNDRLEITGRSGEEMMELIDVLVRLDSKSLATDGAAGKGIADSEAATESDTN